MQQGPPDGAEIAVLLAIYGVVFLVMLAIQLLVCYLLYKPAEAIPAEYRLMEPWHAFLLLIPLFNIVWLFIFPKNLSQSFQRLFAARNQMKDDCGEKLGMWWAICQIAGIIPCLGVFFGIAGLIVMIMYLVKVNECKNLALAGGGPAGGQPLGGPGQPLGGPGYGGPRDPGNPYSV